MMETLRGWLLGLTAAALAVSLLTAEVKTPQVSVYNFAEIMKEKKAASASKTSVPTSVSTLSAVSAGWAN